MSFKSNVGKPHVEPGPDQCEMVDPHHDVQCLEPFVGTVAECCDVRVCSACAVQMEREDFLVAYRPEARFVLVHVEMGVYLGSAIGMGFWSKLDPAGQPAAVTFPDRATAERVMSRWDGGRVNGTMIRPVLPDKESTDGLGDHGLVYASVATCVTAGLPGWDPDAKPCA